MTHIHTRSELLYLAEEEFDKLHHTVQRVPADLRESPGVCGDWSVKDLLVHLDAWHEMFLRWEVVGSTGQIPSMPAVGYTWSEVPALNEEILERHKHDSFELVETRLRHSYEKVLEVMTAHSNDELFSKEQFEWTGATSMSSFAISVSSRHYEWARELIAGFLSRESATE